MSDTEMVIIVAKLSIVKASSYCETAIILLHKTLHLLRTKEYGIAMSNKSCVYLPHAYFALVTKDFASLIMIPHAMNTFPDIMNKIAFRL